MLLVVDEPEEPPLDHDGHDREPGRRPGYPGPEPELVRLGDRVEDVGAEHVERAVREIDDPEHPEDEGEPRGDDEEVHPLGDGVEHLYGSERGRREQSRESRVPERVARERDQCFHDRMALSGMEIRIEAA